MTLLEGTGPDGIDEGRSPGNIKSFCHISCGINVGEVGHHVKIDLDSAQRAHFDSSLLSQFSRRFYSDGEDDHIAFYLSGISHYGSDMMIPCKSDRSFTGDHL